MARVDDLRSDYDRLGVLLDTAEGSAAAALARERRVIGELLETLEAPKGVSVVDQLAARRNAGAVNPDAPARRRKPG